MRLSTSTVRRTSTVLVSPNEMGTVLVQVQYGGRVPADWSKSGGPRARRCLRVYKKFLLGEFADVLNCVLGYVTSCVASIACT